MNSISISKSVKSTLAFISCLMLFLSYYFISICCGILSNNIGYMNLTIPPLTKAVLTVFSSSPFLIPAAFMAAVFAFIAFQKYAREHDPLHVILLITICANSIVMGLFSTVAAGFILPFYRICGTLH